MTVIPFTLRSQKKPNHMMTMDEIFIHHATVNIDPSKYWSHECPRMGNYSTHRQECQFCGTKKGK